MVPAGLAQIASARQVALAAKLRSSKNSPSPSVTRESGFDGSKCRYTSCGSDVGISLRVNSREPSARVTLPPYAVASPISSAPDPVFTTLDSPMPRPPASRPIVSFSPSATSTGRLAAVGLPEPYLYERTRDMIALPLHPRAFLANHFAFRYASTLSTSSPDRALPNISISATLNPPDTAEIRESFIPSPVALNSP